jgi:NADH-quinone oxidoreductase subunit L
MSSVLFLVLVFPLAGAFLLLFPGKMTVRQINFQAISRAVLSLAGAVWIFWQVWGKVPVSAAFKWFSVGKMQFLLSYNLDNTSVTMLVLVSLISLLVQVYSTVYMRHNEHYSHYFAYVGIFTFAMLGLVVAGDWLLLYFFWELVGFSSYLLIGFWGYKRKAAMAARKAFLINRIGDTGLLLGIILLYIHQPVDLQTHPDIFWLNVSGFCMFGGVVAKSAQFPLQTWLPDAMQGPTPASALIHAATMVAAGVFLLTKIFLFFNNEELLLIAFVGAVTALMGAFSALFQTDIKRVLAYSTISQLGFMVLAVGIGMPQLALFHLLTHAFFKACLFLCAGSVIHALHEAQHHTQTHFDTQNMRQMGGLRKKMPVTFSCWAVSGLSLAGVPLFSGFLSKEPILTASWYFVSFAGGWTRLLPGMAFLAAFFTACYVLRQGWLVFGGENLRFEKEFPGISAHVHEVPWRMKLPMLILAAGSVFVWFSFHPLEAEGGWFLEKMTSSPLPPKNVWLTIFSILLFPAAYLTIFLYYRRSFQIPEFIRNLFLYHFYLDIFYKKTFIFLGKKLMQLAVQINVLLDKFSDGLGIITVVFAHIFAWTDTFLVDGMVNFTARTARNLGQLTRSPGNGRIQLYFSILLFTLLTLLVWLAAL